MKSIVFIESPTKLTLDELISIKGGVYAGLQPGAQACTDFSGGCILFDKCDSNFSGGCGMYQDGQD